MFHVLVRHLDELGAAQRRCQARLQEELGNAKERQLPARAWTPLVPGCFCVAGAAFGASGATSAWHVQPFDSLATAVWCCWSYFCMAGPHWRQQEDVAAADAAEKESLHGWGSKKQGKRWHSQEAILTLAEPLENPEKNGQDLRKSPNSKDVEKSKEKGKNSSRGPIQLAQAWESLARISHWSLWTGIRPWRNMIISGICMPCGFWPQDALCAS